MRREVGGKREGREGSEKRSREQRESSAKKPRTGRQSHGRSVWAQASEQGARTRSAYS